jgi:hypothetical protein
MASTCQARAGGLDSRDYNLCCLISTTVCCFEEPARLASRLTARPLINVGCEEVLPGCKETLPPLRAGKTLDALNGRSFVVVARPVAVVHINPRAKPTVNCGAAVSASLLISTPQSCVWCMQGTRHARQEPSTCAPTQLQVRGSPLVKPRAEPRAEHTPEIGKLTDDEQIEGWATAAGHKPQARTTRG